jgi:signal transduction histidine kinase/ActR/RegA family two-component response regulator
MKKSRADAAEANLFAFGKLETAEEIMLLQAASLAGLGYFAVNVSTNRVEACSERHAAVFGLTPEEYIQRATGLDGELSMVHPEDRAALKDGYARVREGQTVQLEYRFLRPDGSFGYIVERVAPELNAEGHVVRALGSSQDVTEARAREALAQQSDRLETLGVFTAGVAHDFNNILAVMMGNAQLGQAHDTTPLMQEILDEIVLAAQRGARLTKSLLAFAQRATIVPSEMRLNKTLTEVAQNFERTKRTNHVLEVVLCEEDPKLLVDADQFVSVIENILDNAVKASPPGGRILMSSSVVADVAQPEAAAHAARAATRSCVVTISDDGVGIPANILHRVTEPFFTTRNRAEGSGLGLSMAQGFARQSGGALKIVSEGQGTTVTLTFPQMIPDHAEKLPGNKAETRQLRILLLEDDPAVSDVLRRQLERAGYEVRDVRKAEEVFAAVRAETFDVAIFDNIIPGPLNGVDVAQRMRSQNIALPVILLTGMPTEPSAENLGAVDALLHKPVRLATLVKQIESCVSVLDAETGHVTRT